MLRYLRLSDCGYSTVDSINTFLLNIIRDGSSTFCQGPQEIVFQSFKFHLFKFSSTIFQVGLANFPIFKIKCPIFPPSKKGLVVSDFLVFQFFKLCLTIFQFSSLIPHISNFSSQTHKFFLPQKRDQQSATFWFSNFSRSPTKVPIFPPFQFPIFQVRQVNNCSGAFYLSPRSARPNPEYYICNVLSKPNSVFNIK